VRARAEIERRKRQGDGLGWEQWLALCFPHVAVAPLANRHRRLWNWGESLKRGTRPPAFVAVWPRGGAKSTTVELVTTRACVNLSRRFLLYVCATQDQANKHVQSVSSLMQRAGVERAVTPYGHSKGWKVNLLRAATGFNVAALGLDAAARGVKLDEFRPDAIILDDIDDRHDSPKSVTRKIETLTDTVLPTGSTDCAVAFVQNRIHEDSVMSQIADGTADFLAVREPVSEEPAVIGLKVEAVAQGPGLPNLWRITEGSATWAGQDIAACQEQINTFGLAAFLRECQHLVKGAAGTFFDTTRLHYIDPGEVPPGLAYCRAWDLAATKGGGDFTAGHLLGVAGRYPDVLVYVVDVRREQWSTDEVYRQIEEAAREDGSNVILRLSQDPAGAGKSQAEQMAVKFKPLPKKRLEIRLESGDKATRAKGFQEAMNRGNVYVVRASWNRPVTEIWRKFREDGAHEHDDDVDAPVNAFNELTGGPNRRAVSF